MPHRIITAPSPGAGGRSARTPVIRSIEQPFAIDEVFHRQFCGGPLAVSYWFFAGVPGSTAATPSGLMLKARNINGSLPGLPHWCTRAYGS